MRKYENIDRPKPPLADDRLCTLAYAGGKHLDLLTPKKGSTKAKNELRKRKKIIEARFDTVLQV